MDYRTTPMSMKSLVEPKICLAILNHNGRAHLEHLLPTAFQAVTNFGSPCPIVLLDNQSSDDDVEWVGSNYPQVDVVVSPKPDYVFSYNWLLARRDESVVILLNNDLKLSPNLIGCLLKHFSDQTTFAVSCKSYSWGTENINSGPCTFKVRHRGWLVAEFQKDRQFVSYTLFCGGGAVAVDRIKFLELGGFDRLFYPAYGEDKDLCFRAWCRGWKCIYEPECHVYHREGGTWDSGANLSRKLIRSEERRV